MMKDIFRIIFIALFVLIINVNTVWIPRGVDPFPEEPIWPNSLADPCVFQWRGTYYMVGTNSISGSRNATFSGLTSTDLMTWTYVGDVLQFVDRPNQTLYFWAPEITEKDNVFYLFYTLGFENNSFVLRVAASNKPLGPYQDERSITLTDLRTEPFAIDSYPFRDPMTGIWYLFYSRNFFDTRNGYRIGSGIVGDRLINNFTALAGNATMIVRPRFDWQIYQANPDGNRSLDWSVLEGVVIWQKEAGVYVCMYSGSNWRNASYGVDYAMSYTSPLGPYIQDLTNEPRLLRTKGDVIGPGHNSITLGRDQRTTYIVYHAWDVDRTRRSPYVSQLNWKRELVANSSSSQDFLHVTLAFLVYFIVILLIFHHAI